MADQDFQKCSKQNVMTKSYSCRELPAIQPHMYCPKPGLETKSAFSFSASENSWSEIWNIKLSDSVRNQGLGDVWD